jgi:3-deoxy-manno-octulosonate cytidylyltransferase (CMP-KDO synthetase)
VRVLAVIPARRGATRLPEKPLRLLGGQPLIVRVWERVASMNLADQIVVATDDHSIADIVQAAGGTARLTRAEHPSGTDRVAEVARAPEFAGAEVVLNIQGDEPFVDESAVRGALRIVARGVAPIGTAAAAADEAILSQPDCVKVVCDDDQRALYFSRAPIPFLRDASDAIELRRRIWQHLGIYAYAPAALQKWVSLPVHPLERIERLEQLRPLAAGMPIGVAQTEQVQLGGIDTEADLVRANAHWDTLYAVRSIA